MVFFLKLELSIPSWKFGAIQKSVLQVLNIVEADSGQCLSIEDHTNCQSKQSLNGTMDQSYHDFPVCSWNNAYLQTCWNDENAKADQGWLYDSGKKLIALASSSEDNVCLEMCNTTTFARGPCSLDNKNLRKPSLATLASFFTLMLSL